jgi:hypothetical protein
VLWGTTHLNDVPCAARRSPPRKSRPHDDEHSLGGRARNHPLEAGTSPGRTVRLLLIRRLIEELNSLGAGGTLQGVLCGKERTGGAEPASYKHTPQSRALPRHLQVIKHQACGSDLQTTISVPCCEVATQSRPAFRRFLFTSRRGTGRPHSSG